VLTHAMNDREIVQQVGVGDHDAARVARGSGGG
jgi:hypothetical protein